MISLFRGLALKKNRLEFINAKRRLMYTFAKMLGSNGPPFMLS